MANLTTLKRKLTTVKRTHPWSLLDETTPYVEAIYGNALRTTTNPVALKLYQPAIEAAWCYVNKQTDHSALYAYRLVKTSSTSWALEYQAYKGGKFVLSFQEGAALNCSVVSGDVFGSLTAWDADQNLFTAVLLLMIPYILRQEEKAGDSRLKDTLVCLEKEIDAHYTQCTAKDDFDPATVEHLFYLSILVEYLGKISVTLNPAGLPDEIPNLQVQHLSGQVISENFPNEVQYVDSTGNVNRYGSTSGMTVAEGIAQFSGYSAHRNWTAKEEALIPKLPDDMPLMEEVVEMAYAITDTHKDTRPIVNYMWRGVTSYGKSTGVEQLAAILNMPLLKITCTPDMEAQNFLANFVPKTNKLDGAAFADGTAEFTGSGEVSDAVAPYLEKTMSHVDTLGKDEKKGLLDPCGFFGNAVMDSASALYDLTGQKSDEDPVTVFALYAEFYAEQKVLALQEKIRELEEQNQRLRDSGAQDSNDQFRLVASPYLKAMTRGYLCEVQELSRIRDSAVFTSLNEFDRPGSVMQILDDSIVRRHEDALLIVTDNVGYNSCRPIDPSVIRRMGGVIDSYELSEKDLKNRVKRNTKCSDTALIDKAYKCWKKVKDYCEQNDVADACCSATELELLVQQVMHRGMDSFASKLEVCVISKATNDREIQNAIRDAVTALVSA